jgi:hypothetical protein
LFLSQVTLTTENTIYQLYSLIKAVAPNTSPSTHQLNIQYDISGTGFLYIGNSAVSASSYGFVAIPGDSMNFQATFNGLGLDSIYLTATTNAQVVNIISMDM